MSRRVNVLLLGLMMCPAVFAFSPQRLDEDDSLIFLQKNSYVVFYNIARQIPALVAWNLTKKNLGRHHRPGNISFRQDVDCPKPRAKAQSFVNTGFQRGHLCPSADRSADNDQMRATFVMSNVAPMTAALNTVQWAQAEDYSRCLVRYGHDCHLMAGAFISDSAQLLSMSSKIHVPDSFFRACIVHDAPQLSVFWLMANDTIRRSETACRVGRRRFLLSLRKKVRIIFDNLDTL